MSAGADRRPHTIGLLAVAAAVLCFSISYPILKWPGVPGSVIAWWRLVGSSVLWWVLLIVRRRRYATPLPTRATWKRMIVPALFFGLDISILFTAVTRTSVAHAEFIGVMAPLITLPAGFFLFGERPRWRALGWGTLSIIGIAIVLFNGPERGTATVTGDVLMAIGVVMLSAYLLAAKRARGHRGAVGVDTFEFMAILMPVALVTATPVVLSIASNELWPLSGKAWIAVAILSVLTGMVGHGLLAFAHPRLPIGTMSTVQVSQPALAVFWAWVILGETITARQVPGMALVIIGLALVMWFSNRAAVEPAV